MGMGATFLPGGRMTGIGSLPIKKPEAAVAFVARFCPEIPFWPQLLRRSRREAMVPQALGTLTKAIEKRKESYGYNILPDRLAWLEEGLACEAVQLTELHAAGFFAFERALEAGHFPHAIALKGQLVGPITLAGQLFVEGKPLARQADWLAKIGHYVACLARWQVRRLQRHSLPVVLMVDEPALLMANPEGDHAAADRLIAALREVVAAIQAAGGIAGIRCWGGFPVWSIPLLKPDVISFDAYHELETVLSAEETQHFMQAGGVMAFGMVPSWPEVDTLTAEALLQRWKRGVAPILAPRRAAQQTIITTTHGLGLLDDQAAEISFRLAKRLSRLLRARFPQAVAPPLSGAPTPS
ncbi:MAG: hypothetical protein D6796_11325 [Caldilineae bacterium]|nr:MAG: hypothetical protein D6796_11325 [Caldilineae bacterium]